MKYNRIVISKFGVPGVLEKVTETELPKPQKGQVRVKVLAVSASYTDTLIRRGLYPAVRKKPPFSPGYDLVGLVDALGEGVTHLSIGQKVADLTVIGAYTEYICLDADALVEVPDHLDNGEAVSMILSYLTAYQMLHRVVNLERSSTILIHACSGAVGIAMLQLGKLLDLKMYGTASENKHEFVKALGAIPIDYKNEDFAEIIRANEPDGIDVVFDPIGGSYFPRSASVLKKKGTLVGYGYQNAASGVDGHVVLDFFKIMFWNLLPGRPASKFYVITSMRNKQADWFKEDLKVLFELLAEKRIKPVIGKVMKLDQAAEAHELVENYMVTGKVILTVND